MHNQVRVCFSHCLEHFKKEMDTGMRIQMMLVAITVDLIAVNIFENEVRLSASRHACVDQLCNVLMGKKREYPSLALEPLFTRLAHERNVEKLDGDTSFEASIVALREPHTAHAALADLRNERVNAD